MEPAARAPRAVTRAVERFRAAVACLLLTALVFAQDAGRVVADTKLDLVVDPVGLLARSLHLWDPQGGAGQLQNQAYGYLFPMGPFFAGLQGAGLPDWAVQRLWQSLVLCTALLGVRALAARLGLGSPATRLLAGVAYALASRPVSQVGAISVEVWPYALAPWVLVPLVTGARRGSPRRAAALSGLAVLLVGGVNAAATLAVVPLGALWIALQPPGPRRRRLAGWWAVALACACAWWIGPLLVLGRYSPPFLDVIESAATTTSQTGLWAVLSGNDLWLQYLALGEAARPAGLLLVTSAALVVCTTALTALGLAGLLDRSAPHRGFLVGGVLLGLLVVGAGHVGALDGPFAALERELLDGPLAPFRNVHKYDLLLRLPLALGLAHAAATVRLPARPALRPVAVLAAIALVGAASPAVTSLQPAGSFPALPQYWSDVADFLDDADDGPAPPRALVVPAAVSGDYQWGSPRDEPLQALARSPWVVRDAVPLGGPGVTRVLDSVEEALRSGRGSPALAQHLARAGVRHVVVRNDLDANAAGASRPVVVHAALAASPGLVKVAEFGPAVGGGLGTGRVVLDAQLAPLYPAVEVFEVVVAADPPAKATATVPVGAVTTWPRSGTQRVSGGPESVLPLLESGALPATGATRLAGEPALPGEETELRTVTDGYRDREVGFGQATDPASATLGGGVRPRAARPVRDYLPVPARGTRTTALVRGVAEVRASSSAAESDALALRGRDHHPAAAFDRDGSTTWVTGGLRPRGQWVEARLLPGTRLARVDVSTPYVAGAGTRPTRVRVTTDAGSTDVVLRGADTRVPLTATAGRVRITLTELDGLGPAGLGVAALEARLVTVEEAAAAPPPARGETAAERGLRVPADSSLAGGGRPASGRLAYVFSAGRRDRPGCLPLGQVAVGASGFGGEESRVCAAELPLADEDSDAVDRTLVLDERSAFDVAVRARARPGAELDARLQRGQAVVVTASSTLVAGARPPSVVDGDLETGWIAAPLDEGRRRADGDPVGPTLTLTLDRPQRITGVQLYVDENLAASRPRSVRLLVDGRLLPAVDLVRGVARLPAAVRVSRTVAVSFPDVEQRLSVRRDGLVEVLPVGVTELTLTGPPFAAVHQRLDRAALVALPCGQGPVLELDGRVEVATRVRATVGDLLDGAAVGIEPCSGLSLVVGAGEHRVRMARTAEVQVDGVTLTGPGRAPEPGASRVERVRRWGDGARSLDVADGPESWLVVHEAYNAGWTARLDGRRLVPARLDGWQQGFVLPSRAGRVELEFTPDRPYRLALVAGLVLALVLVVLCALPPRGRPLPDARPRRRTRPGPALAAIAVALVGGLAGLGALVVAGVVVRLLPRALPVLAVAGLLAAGGLVALRPWPDPALVGAPVQALCLLCVAALAVSLWPLRGRAAAAAAPAPPPPAGTPSPPAR